MEVEYEEKYFEDGSSLGGYMHYADYPAHAARVEKLIKITRPESVLDVGCAYGFIVKRLLNKRIPSMGCDVSEYAEVKAKDIIPGHFHRCPAWDLRFEDKSFDLIYCEGVLEHIPEEKIDDVFSEFDRVANRFYLQVSFSSHAEAEKIAGHLCVKDFWWWFTRMPMHSWLFLGRTGTEADITWSYKG